MPIKDFVIDNADYLNDLDNKAYCEVGSVANDGLDLIKGLFGQKEIKKNELFKEGMYALNDCKIIKKRMEVLEIGDLNKHLVTGIVLHQTSGQTALSTMTRYHKENIENVVMSKIFGRMSVEGIGAHFLISPSGTIYQTARIDKFCYHVGPYINSPCFVKKSCKPSENELYTKIMNDSELSKHQKWSAITSEELKKNWGDRYARSNESIGIEVVGMPDNNGKYPLPKVEQMGSVKWLVGLLQQYFNVKCDRVFAHGQISPHKNNTEAISMLESVKKTCR